MNLAHIHLLVNHFPTVGTIIALGLFLVARASKSADLKLASLVLFVLISLITIPTYMSGNAAEEMLRGRAGVSFAAIEAHRNAAQLAVVFMELTGVVSWFGLWKFRRQSNFGRGTLPTILVLSLVTLGVVGYAANLGGGIRHPEIEDSGATKTAAAKNVSAAPEQRAAVKKLEAGGVSDFVTDHKWLWPACQTLHLIGLSLLMGVVLLIDMRMLGVVKNISFPAVHRLLPWGVLGFSVNVLTGMLFFAARSTQYTTNTVFQWKMALVILAGVNALYFTMLDEAWTLKAGDDASLTAKVMASSALFLWLTVLFCGRMLPFLGGSF
jgi:uncharacterized membrane protein